MPAQLEPFQDSPTARTELVPFLMAQFQGEGACDEQQWMKRMAYWWDENPFANAHPCRGWVLRDEGRIVGYLGTIPTFYEDMQWQPTPALIATTWAIAEEHRNAALAMGMMLQRQSRTALLIDTTPSPEVQALLHRWGWQASTQIRRSLVMRGASFAALAKMMSPEWSDLASGKEITTDLSRVTAICTARPRPAIQKHITPEYLRWYAASPMREHYFLGVVDDAGKLSSYLMLTPKYVKGLPSWKVMDWFTTQESKRELTAMIAHLLSNSPAEHGNWWPLISLAAFLPDNPWAEVAQVYQRLEGVNHFYCLPPTLKGSPIRSVMAEGDWGL
jgi:hypothetical protein